MGSPSLLINPEETLFKIIVAPLRWSQRMLLACWDVGWLGAEHTPRVMLCRMNASEPGEFSDMQICFVDRRLFLLCAA